MNANPEAASLSKVATFEPGSPEERGHEKRVRFVYSILSRALNWLPGQELHQDTIVYQRREELPDKKIPIDFETTFQIRHVKVEPEPLARNYQDVLDLKAKTRALAKDGADSRGSTMAADIKNPGW